MPDDTIRGGAHGTSVTRADKIEKYGFKPSDGIRGTGIYFWRQSPYSRYLARSWWSFKYSRQHYKYDKDQRCCIIEVTFEIEEQEFLDLDDKVLKDSYAALCLEKKLTRFSRRRERVAVLNTFVKRLESKLGTVFKVIESSVTTPPKDFSEEYPLDSLGAPSCYIVFDAACVRITNRMIC